MNAFFSALILFVQYFADFAETFRILRWLMGDSTSAATSRFLPRCRWWSSRSGCSDGWHGR